MSNKDEYCRKILKEYSIIVDYDGDVNRINLPAPIDENETFKQWKERVLGDQVENVVVYFPEIPAQQTRIATLQEWCAADPIDKVFRSLNRLKDQKNKEAIARAVDKTAKSYETLSKDTIQNILDTDGGLLEPSVANFLQNLLNDPNESIDTEDLFKTVINNYSNAVRKYRELQQLTP